MTPDGQNANTTSHPNLMDALNYMDAVKARFTDTPCKYNSFLDSLNDFKSGVIDTPGLLERMSALLRGHVDLIEGFNAFLPPVYRLDCATEDTEVAVTTMTTPSGASMRRQQLADGDSDLLTNEASKDDDSDKALLAADISNSTVGVAGSRSSPSERAIQYVTRVNRRFQNTPGKYKQFLGILNKARHEERSESLEWARSQVQVLFKDEPDLLAEFDDFVPGTRSTSVTAETLAQQIVELELEEEQNRKAKL